MDLEEEVDGELNLECNEDIITVPEEAMDLEEEKEGGELNLECKEEVTTVPEETIGLEEEKDEELKLKCKEGDIITVSEKVMRQSGFITAALSDEGADIDDVIDLKLVEKDMLKKVIDWCTYHRDKESKKIEKPLKSMKFEVCVPDEYDQKFSDLKVRECFILLMTANYLDVNPLIELMAARIASFLRGKSQEQIRKILGLADDYTPEEEERILKENDVIINYQLPSVE